MILRLDNVSRRFGERTAVDGLSLEIARGELFGLLGPNGAGKTTLSRMILGLIPPSDGRIEFNGEPLARRHLNRIGVAPQELAVYDDLTGEENLRFFGRLQGMSGDTLRRRIGEMLELAGLQDRARTRVRTWSGGMKRRLNIAVALIHDPDLVVLDEPTVGVDPQSRTRILDAIGGLRETGKTIIYTTHYMDEAQRLCSRVGIIDHGKLLDLDTVDGLLDKHGGPDVVIATLDDGGDQRIETTDPVAELSRMKAAGGLRRFRVERPDLEQVFIHLTGRQLRD